MSGSNCAKKFERWKDALARLTIGPTTSPKPMQRKARNIGVDFQKLLDAEFFEATDSIRIFLLVGFGK